ncbi:MAG: YibE/F family protein, partial [Eubacteriales bacterium]
ITILAIFKILIPFILKGWDPVILSVGICILIITISLIIISGFTKKTTSAIIGTVGGVVVAGVIALIVGTLCKLTGLGNEESQMLMYIPQGTILDFRGLLFAGIIIGAMGATMDVGMSIASAMHEIKENSPDIKSKDLIKAGMNVGRDMMATMANTLILAYTGGSIQLILVFMAYNTSFSTVINWDMIASEILRAISGSIGIIFTIPITALVAGFIEERFVRH